MIDPEDAFIVNALVWQVLVYAQEMMGENGMNAVLRSLGQECFVDEVGRGCCTEDEGEIRE